MIGQKIDLIFQEIKGIRVDQVAMRGDIHGIKKDQDVMKGDIQELNSRFDTLESKVDHTQSDIKEMKQSITRIDQTINEDLIVILKSIDQETKERSAETAVLNDRIFRLEVRMKKIDIQ